MLLIILKQTDFLHILGSYKYLMLEINVKFVLGITNRL